MRKLLLAIFLLGVSAGLSFAESPCRSLPFSPHLGAASAPLKISYRLDRMSDREMPICLRAVSPASFRGVPPETLASAYPLGLLARATHMD